MEVEKRIRQYLKGVIHLSLSTSKGNKPWVCEVHYAYDKDLNLYFRSVASRRHSVEIAKNPFVAGNIVEQHGLEDKPRGVYFEGKATMLKDVDKDHPAYIEYDKRFDTGQGIIKEAKQKTGHKFYKIKVKNFYMFDSRESRPSKKYTLPW